MQGTEARNRIDFFIAGAQKAGTTALYEFLRGQPGVQMSVKKEPHHFDDEEGVDWRDPDHVDLHRFYDWSREGVVRGEATPIYVFWPNALERIRAYNPDAKLIIGLRHPAFRAHSQWLMNIGRGVEPLSFADAIGQAGRSRLLDGSLVSMRRYSYIERGFYSRQIERAMRLFPRNQLHFYRTDSLWKDPMGSLLAIAGFLGFEAVEDTLGGYVSPYERTVSKTLEASDREYLERLFEEDIRRTEDLTGLDLSDWRSPDYEEPMLPTAHG